MAVNRRRMPAFFGSLVVLTSVACSDRPASQPKQTPPVSPSPDGAPSSQVVKESPALIETPAPAPPAENLVLRAAEARIPQLEAELAAIPEGGPKRVPRLQVRDKPEDGLRQVQARIKTVRAASHTLEKLAGASPYKDPQLEESFSLMRQLFQELDKQCETSEKAYYANKVDNGNRLGREAAKALFQLELLFAGIEDRVADPAATRRRQIARELEAARETVAAERNAGTLVGTPTRLAHLDACVTVARLQPWGAELKQIPATVIDKGVLRHVPYVSYKAGEHEVNIYGDPASPAGLEVGLYGRLTGSEEERQACFDFIAGILGQTEDRDALRQLNPDEDSRTRDGLTFEVTPPTAADAYGGWWVSVYNEVALERARATDSEIATLSMEATQLAELLASGSKEPLATPQASKVFTNADVAYFGGFSRSDVEASRPSSSSAGKRVYVASYSRSDDGYRPKEIRVSGYTKKDGTVVESYTRAAPSRKK